MDKAHQINDKFLKRKEKISAQIQRKTLKPIDSLHIFNNNIFLTTNNVIIIHTKTNGDVYTCESVVENNQVKMIPNTTIFYKDTTFQDTCQEEFHELDIIYQAYKKELKKEIKRLYYK